MANRDRSDVSAAITRAMKRLQISQAELATRAGVTQSYISQICTGRRAPALETLRRICGVLGISLGELNRAPVEDAAGQDAGRRLTEEETYLVDCYRAMSQQDKNVLFGVANLLEKDVRRDSGELTSVQPHFIGKKS